MANDLEDAGAGYFVLNLGQSDGKYCSPNTIYEGFFTVPGSSQTLPSGYLTSEKDLPMDLSNALVPKDIKLFLYLNFDGPSQANYWAESDPVTNPRSFEQHFLGEGIGLTHSYTQQELDDVNYTWPCLNPKGQPGPCPVPFFTCFPETDDKTGTTWQALPADKRRSTVDITDAYIENWADVIEEWSLRYTDKVSGWFFDHADENGYASVEGNMEDYYEMIRNAVLAGNPDAIVSFNPGAINAGAIQIDQTLPIFGDLITGPSKFFLDNAENQDFHFGEISACTKLENVMGLWKDDQVDTTYYGGNNVFQGRRIYKLDGNDELDISTSSQFHSFITMGSYWAFDNVAMEGEPNSQCTFNGSVSPDKTHEAFEDYICEAIKEGGVTTIAIGNILNSPSVGSIPQEQYDELLLIKDFVRDNNCGFNDDEDLLNIRRYNPTNNPIYANKDIIAVSNDNRADVAQHESNAEFDEWIMEETTHTPLNSSTTYTDIYRFFNVDTKKYMTIRAGAYNEGAEYQQNIWNDYSSQKWYVEEDPNNSSLMRIRSFHNSIASPSNNYYATVLYGSQWGGTPIINKQWNNDDFQKWEFIYLNGSPRPAPALQLEEDVEDVFLYPNPTSQEVTISLKDFENETINKIEVRTKTGVLIQELSINNKATSTINVGRYAKDLYLVKIYTSKGVYIKKLIKE